MYLEADIKTEAISGTRNPEFNYERRFTFEQCPPEVRNFVKCIPAVLIVICTCPRSSVAHEPRMSTRLEFSPVSVA